MHLYHFYFNFILFAHTVQTNFDFNQCSIFTECCCFWPWKRFEWSKSLLLRFPSSYELNPPSKISHPPPLRGIPLPPPLFGKPCPEACRVMVLEQPMHYNFPFKFSFQYVDISWYRLLPILVPSCSPISYTWCPPWWGEQCSPHHYDAYGKPYPLYEREVKLVFEMQAAGWLKFVELEICLPV